ncbi:MAG: chromosome partitioning protein ParB family [Rhodospirillaceae bacterium]|nr:MAG: chromosome partitioning protein ParB family [Rhodospirillaceae bacterium]
MSKAQRLGRGLSSLLGDDAIIALPKEATHEASIDSLHPGRFQPRHHFDEAAIASLVDSIRQRGILQPILVRPLAEQDGHYEIIAGERRWRAAQQAQLHEVPIVIRTLSDREALEVALVENLQRQDLSPLEEAEGYNRLIEEFHHTQEELAQAISKSRSHVANMMRLLALPDLIKTMLDQGALSAGHARALLGAREPVKLARTIVTRGLNVRQVERLVQKEGGKAARKHTSPPSRDADLVALERDVSHCLGFKVRISFSGQGGTLTIHYNTLEQLDDILLRLNASALVHKTATDTLSLPAEDALASLAYACAYAEEEMKEEEQREGEAGPPQDTQDEEGDPCNDSVPGH